jgi:alpha-amylase
MRSPELNSKFGTREDLQALSSALHERGMYLMVDVVVNHVGFPRGREFRPDERYGVLNQPEDYHPHCWIRNYDNQTEVEQCWIGEDQREALVDVNTESPKVVQEMYRWIKQLVSDYQIDGLRVDTVKHGKSWQQRIVEAKLNNNCALPQL